MMPVTPTYPGVYVEEVPSGVRTITGVATSIAAFIGRAQRGPIDEPVTINNFGDFERVFGGLWNESALGFAVRDFYRNGGSQAVIVRLYHADPGDPGEPAGTTKFSVGGLSLAAASPGAWGEYLRASVETGEANVSKDLAENWGLAVSDLFNLTVRDAGPGGTIEVFRNLTVQESPQRIDRVLEARSQLARFVGTIVPPPVVAAGSDAVTVADEASAAAKKQLTNAEQQLAGTKQQLAEAQAAEPPDPAAVTAAEAAVSDAEDAVSDAEGEVTTAGDALKNAKDALETSDGLALSLNDDFNPTGAEANKKGLYALNGVDLFNLLCIPPYLAGGDVEPDLMALAATYCEDRRAMLLVDPRTDWSSWDRARDGLDGVGTRSKNSALFFPRLRQPNPLKDNQFEEFAPCGAVAGVFARTDAQRGVWKAPAGLDAGLVGVPDLAVRLTDDENGQLNPLGINCLRSRPPAGRIVWGSRTLQGDDRLASEWKYVPVRRLALFLEESLYRGTQWAVFEPNDEPLWAQMRLNVGAFMRNLFRQGAFQGSSPKDAYFVKCDHETTTQNDIDLGIVNILVGFAPLKPAEFVILKIQLIAGQIET